MPITLSNDHHMLLDLLNHIDIDPTAPNTELVLEIALKECFESEYWLELLFESEYITSQEFNSIYPDCEEIIKKCGNVKKAEAYLLENNIIEQPELWLWTHNRWKYPRPQQTQQTT